MLPRFDRRLAADRAWLKENLAGLDSAAAELHRRSAMSDRPLVAGEPVAERNNTRLYAGVIVVEVVVLAAIWLFQRYFGA